MSFGHMQYHLVWNLRTLGFRTAQSRAVSLVKQALDNNLFLGLFCIVLRPNLDERQLEIKTDLTNVEWNRFGLRARTIVNFSHAKLPIIGKCFSCDWRSMHENPQRKLGEDLSFQRFVSSDSSFKLPKNVRPSKTSRLKGHKRGRTSLLAVQDRKYLNCGNL